MNLKLLSLILFLWAPGALGNASARVTALLKTLDDTIAQKQATSATLQADPSSKDWVKSRLEQMVAVDQYARLFINTPLRSELTPAEQIQFRSEVGQRWGKIDAANTNELKELIKKHGWFKIGAFGEQADNNAWLLVQHADLDPAPGRGSQESRCAACLGRASA